MHESIFKEHQLGTVSTSISLQDIRTLKELYQLKAETRELRAPVVYNII